MIRKICTIRSRPNPPYKAVAKPRVPQMHTPQSLTFALLNLEFLEKGGLDSLKTIDLLFCTGKGQPSWHGLIVNPLLYLATIYNLKGIPLR